MGEIKKKYILPKFFFTHDLQKNGDIDVQQVCSHENLEYFFTKSLPRKTFEQLTHKIEFYHLKDIVCMTGRNKYILNSFSLRHGFVPLDFNDKVSNEAGDYIWKNDVFFFFLL